VSWWETGREDEWIGDEPADALGSALDDLRARAEARFGRAPRLDELLAWFASALQARWGSAAPRVLAATPSAGDPVVAEAHRPPDPVLAGPIDAALDVVVRSYEETWEREPRITEILDTLAFVVRPDPTRYVGVVEADLTIDDIEGTDAQPLA
jgi:hypothetical protein